jgi:hypothetical protein
MFMRFGGPFWHVVGDAGHVIVLMDFLVGDD